MTESLPHPGSARRAGAGFTLLEIMIALAILAVGSICVLSTFAAAIALHQKREADVRGARVLEEARAEAQEAWDAWRPEPNKPLPAKIDNLFYSRDSAISYNIVFEPVSGQPKGLDGTASGVNAVVTVHRDGQDAKRDRLMKIFLTRSGFRAEDMKSSVTYEQEKEADKKKESDPSKRKDR